MSNLAVGERKTCEACGAALVGAETANGKTAPVENEPSEHGNVLLQRQKDGVVRAITFGRAAAEDLRAKGVELRLNHFASCEHAARFRPNTTTEGTGT